MSPNVILFAWDRSAAGREAMSAQHFQSFMEYLGTQQRNGAIESFDPVLIEPHGGHLNGFFLIRGEPGKLTQMLGSDEWVRHQVRGLLHLEGAATLRGVSGAEVGRRMALWMQEAPKS